MGFDAIAEPLDIMRLCRLGRFDLETVTLHGAEGRLQALLFPTPINRFSILVDPEPPGGWEGVDSALRSTLSDHRWRFRICHEVAHTFFFDRSGEVPRPILGPSPKQEQFCDEFASHLLVPRETIADLPARATSVVEVHERFRVSLEVAARAFAAVHRDVLTALYVTQGDKPPLLQWTNRPRERQRLDTLLSNLGRPCRKHQSLARLEKRGQVVAVACC